MSYAARGGGMLAGIFLTVSSLVFGQANIFEFGYPQIDRYFPKDYQAHSQTWGMIQADDGRMYFGNGDGVLEFDGQHWNLFRTSIRNRVRELVKDQNGTIYAYGTGDFGYLSTNESGQTIFVSLKKFLDSSHQDVSIRDMLVWNEKVVFLARTSLLIWDGAAFAYLDAEDLSSLVLWQDELFVFQKDRYYLVGANGLTEKALPHVPKGEFVRKTIIHSNGYYYATSTGIYTSNGTGVRKLSHQIDAIFEDQFYSDFVVLPDGRMLVGTGRGIYLLSPDGEVLFQMTEEEGLNSTRIHYLYLDRSGAVWASLDQGLARINMHVPFRYFDKRNGLPGIVNDVLSVDEALYVTTHDGAFRLSGDGRGFEPVLSPNPESFKMLWIEGELMILTANGVFVYDPKTADSRRIQPFYGYKIFQSRVNPERIFVCSVQGLYAFTWRNGRVVETTSYAGLVPDLVRFIEEDEEGNLWLGSTKDPVYRLTLYANKQPVPPEVSIYSTKDGLPVSEIKINRIRGDYLFSTLDGVFAFTGTGFVRHPDFKSDTLMTPFIHASQSEDLIYLLHGNTPFMKLVPYQIAANGYAPASKPELHLFESSGLWMASEDANHIIWLASTDGLIAYNPGLFQPSDLEMPTLMSRIEKNDSLIVANAAGANGDYIQFPMKNNAFRFEFAIPSYDLPDKSMFRVRMDGLDESWSGWMTSDTKEYTNLPFGDYTLHVQGRDAMGNEGTEATFAFRILTPWYLTAWFIALVIVLVLAVVVVVVRYYSRVRLKRRVNELEMANKIQMERERISRNLHDDVGAQLTSIISGIKHAEEMDGITQNAGVKDMLFSLKEDAEESISNLRDTIWTLNKQSITMEEFYEQVEVMAESMLKFTNVNHMLSCDVDGHTTIKPLVAFHLKKVIQECLHNIVKHAGATNAWIQFAWKRQRLQVVVSDDGCGMKEQEASGQHFGLSNMKNRMEEMGGTFAMTSDESGTKVQLTTYL